MQAGVVHGGLTIAEILDQEISDRAALEGVSVDEFGGSALSRAAQLRQGGGCLAVEAPEGMQSSVEQSCGTEAAGATSRRFDVEELQHVTGCDIADCATLMGHDHRRAVQAAVRRGGRHQRIRIEEGLQPIESLATASAGEATDEGAPLNPARTQPGQGWSNEVGADRRRHCSAEDPIVVGDPAGGEHPFLGHRSPLVLGFGRVDAAREPPVLPCFSRLRFEPIEHPAQALRAGVLFVVVIQREWGTHQPRPRLVAVTPGFGPSALDRTGRPPCSSVIPGGCCGLVGDIVRRVDDCGLHEIEPPKSTSNDSGRYSGASRGGVCCTVRRVCSAWWARIRRMTSSLRGVR